MIETSSMWARPQPELRLPCTKTDPEIPAGQGDAHTANPGRRAVLLQGTKLIAMLCF